MDSDDIARPDRFEKQLRHFATSDTDILGGVIEEFRATPGDLNLQNLPPEPPGYTGFFAVPDTRQQCYDNVQARYF